MTTWEKRPLELANLFNPAFCAVIIKEAIEGYHAHNQNYIPFPIVFLILPIVLHKTTREALPVSTATKLHTWIQQNPEIRVSFSRRMADMKIYTQEAIMFGLRQKLFSIGEDGTLIAGAKINTRALNWDATSEPNLCMKKSRFLGRWLAQAGEVTTIFTMWGIRP